MISLRPDLPCYVAAPAGEPRAGLVVVHEIWGLSEHITQVADRFAAEGYLVAAPDLLSSVGVSPKDGEELRRLMSSADQAERTTAQPAMREKTAPAHTPEFGRWAVGALSATIDHLAAQPGVGDRLGIAGFCFGGTYAFAGAVADDRLRAAVPFYGQPPELDEVGSIHCPVLAFYGDQDERLMSSLPAVRTAMEQAGVDFRAQVYAGARHAFFNDTNAMAYDAAAAADAWQRTLAFLAEHVG